MGAEIKQDWEDGYNAGIKRAIDVITWGNEIGSSNGDMLERLQEIQNE